MRVRLSIIFFRLLKRSRVFAYWYRRHLNELLYELELHDIEPMDKKIKKRLERL